MLWKRHQIPPKKIKLFITQQDNNPKIGQYGVLSSLSNYHLYSKKFMPFLTKNNFLISIVYITSILFCIQFIDLVNLDLLNNFPFLSSDSFDYIVESEALFKKFIYGREIAPLEVLRNPLLISIIFLDNVFGGYGTLIGIISSLSLLIQFLFTKKILEIFKKVSFFDQIVIFIFVFLININAYKFYILAENICIALIMVSSYYLLLFYKLNRIIFFRISYLFLFIGFLGQFYVLVPFVCINFYYNFSSLINSKKLLVSKKNILEIFCVFILVILVYVSWRQIPHLSVVNNLSTFGSINFDTIIFYSKLWGYYFGLIFLSLFFLFIFKKAEIKKFQSSILFTIFMHVVLCLHYTWLGDPRFTLIFSLWIVVFFLSFSHFFSNLYKLLFVVFHIFISFIQVPHMMKDTFDPFRDINIDFKNNKFIFFMMSNPTDRRLDHYSHNANDRLIFLNSSTPYQRKIFSYYFKNLTND